MSFGVRHGMGGGHPVVNVLLSYYQGAEHIQEQLASIASQEGVTVRLAVRNDGPPCASLEAGLDAVRDSIEVTFFQGENLGFAKSFLSLLDASEQQADYFAFCDQDDVWLPGKLRKAVDTLEALKDGGDIPSLSVCNYELVDQSLNPIRRNVLRPAPSVSSAICENLFPGHLFLFNRSLRDLCVGAVGAPILCHDWYVMLVATLLGRVVVNGEHIGVLYRQHASNALGDPSSLKMLENRFSRLGRFLNKPVRVSDQARWILSRHKDQLGSDVRKILDDFVESRRSPVARMRLALSGKFRRQDPLDSLIFRTQIAFGVY